MRANFTGVVQLHFESGKYSICGKITDIRGNFKTPQNCQSALYFDLIKGAFFRLRIKLRRDKRLLPCR